MSGKSFLDTNILIYSFDNKAPAKRDIARHLIKQALVQENGCISFQVIQEFFNVTRRKFATPLFASDAKIYLNEEMSPLCRFFPDISFYSQTIQIAERWKYSWYDSLIISAALSTQCETLYSEDLRHNQKLDKLTIINPFC